MAKKHLEQYDKNGNRLDIYLNKGEVMVDNKTLGDKLDEMDAAIEKAAAQGGIQEETDPTVPSWAKQPNKPTYTASEVGALPANTAIPTKTSDLNNDSGFVTETEMESAIEDAVDGLGGEVSVTTNEDGTFVIHVGDTDYTINLNHTHENMAKIVKCTEATLPQTLDNDTIYVQVDNATTPTDIECLYLFGLEFTGGGLPAGVPQISKPTPNSTINLGTAYGQGGATGTVKIKGRSLTANSTVVVSVGSGFSLSYGQQSGSSINIDAADVILGCDVTVYATAYGTSGTILITSQTDSLSVEANLTSNVIEDLAGVKLTGTQWLQTDYKPNDKTEFTLDVKFTPNSHTEDYPATGSGALLQCPPNSVDGKKFRLYLGGRNSASVPKGAYMILLINESSVQYGSGFQFITYTSDTNQQEYLDFIVDHSIIQYAIEPSNGRITFSNTSTNRSCITSKKTSTMENNMMIGKHETEGILTRMDFTIYSLEIREQGNVVRRYTAKRLNGIPHLYEEITGTFLRSETAKVSGLAADELVAVE